MNDHDQDLDRLLRGLPRETSPPAELEERVTSALRSRGLVRSAGSDPRRRRESHRWGMAAAACLVGLLAGWAARGVYAAPEAGVPAAKGNHFLLLLSEPHGLDTSKTLPELVAEYRAWAGGLAAEGRLLAAERLTGERADLGGASSEAGDATGFFLVVADDLEAARDIAATCPHLRYGGEVTVWRAASRDDR